MAQAAVTHSIALVAPYIWSIDEDVRRMVDWVRTDMVSLVDEYFDVSPAEMRRCLFHEATQMEVIIDRVPSGLDHERLCDVRARIDDLGKSLSRVTPDQLADRLMVAAHLLVTGTAYQEGDAPAAFM